MVETLTQKNRSLRWCLLIMLLLFFALAALISGVYIAFIVRGQSVSGNITRMSQGGYDSPITITRGGTYSGNWRSLNPNIPAVTIDTTEPVVIENATIQSRGPLIASAVEHAKLTVRGCHGYGLSPNTSGRSLGRFIDVYRADSVDVEYNYLEETSGISFTEYGGTAQPGQTFKVMYNHVHNIDGRKSDGAGGFSISPSQGVGWDYAAFVQLNQVHHVPGIEVSWNEVMNEPGRSRTEDTISVYLSSGRADSPIQIHDNYLQGGYSAPPGAKKYTGTSINLGDGNATNLDEAAGFVRAFNNQVISSSNAGIAISAGHDSEIFNNRVVSTGKLVNGETVATPYAVGVAVLDYYHDKAEGTFFNNVAYGNTIGVVNSYGVRNDTWLPDCSITIQGWTRCINNEHLPNPITRTTEAKEYMRWQSKLKQARVSIGPEGESNLDDTNYQDSIIHVWNALSITAYIRREQPLTVRMAL